MYRRHALNLIEAVRRVYPGVEGKTMIGAKGAFEIDIQINANDKPISVWSGVKRGPPRRLKFPEADELIKSLKPFF